MIKLPNTPESGISKVFSQGVIPVTNPSPENGELVMGIEKMVETYQNPNYQLSIIN